VYSSAMLLILVLHLREFSSNNIDALQGIDDRTFPQPPKFEDGSIRLRFSLLFCVLSPFCSR
jgi:hypothetical protein